MKKFTSLLLVAALVFAFAGCGSKNGGDGADAKSEGVMTYEEYVAAALDSEVVTMCRQSSPGGKIRLLFIPRIRMAAISCITWHVLRKTTQS